MSPPYVHRPTSELIEVSLVNDPVVRLIVDQATQLNEQMKIWDEMKREVEGHPKDCIPANVREAIVKWLSSKSQVSEWASSNIRVREVVCVCTLTLLLLCVCVSMFFVSVN